MSSCRSWAGGWRKQTKGAGRERDRPRPRVAPGCACYAGPRVSAHHRGQPRAVVAVYDTVLPLLGTIAFVYVYKALGAPDRFVGYVIMGGGTVAFWMDVMLNIG